jgi:hypothetical protein
MFNEQCFSSEELQKLPRAVNNFPIISDILFEVTQQLHGERWFPSDKPQ